MPVKFGLWRVDGDAVEQVAPGGTTSEERLEEIIEERIEFSVSATSSRSVAR